MVHAPLAVSGGSTTLSQPPTPVDRAVAGDDVTVRLPRTVSELNRGRLPNLLRPRRLRLSDGRTFCVHNMPGNLVITGLSRFDCALDPLDCVVRASAFSSYARTNFAVIDPDVDLTKRN